ncbi:MAG: hypothetical protein JWL63_1796 [Rhodocyclales bacterium]|nr:hypothetical protein [Rhodocyclales bacterium]
MVDAFSVFAQSRRVDLRRIAARTCGEYTEADIVSEAWLVAEKIAQQRGFPVDFGNAIDQKTVLAWLFNHLVRYADKQVRYAVRLDKDWDQEDAGAVMASLSRMLIAPEEFDPAVALQLFEERDDFFSLTHHSYSQATAYAILLERFDWELDDLADHLCIVAGTLRTRIYHCVTWIRYQPSLFDRINAIELDFVPLKARWWRRLDGREPLDSSRQMAWTEGCWLSITMGGADNRSANARDAEG